MTASPERLLERFGDGIRGFLDRAGKAHHSSNIFDLRRRTLIGCYCYFDHLPWVLDVLNDLTTPAELGAAGRGICGAPFGPQIHGLLWGYLLARENELGLGRNGGSPRDLERLLGWWAGMAEAYRGDGALLPHEARQTQPAASPALIAGVLREHGAPIEAQPQLGRLTAALQLYNYILRGEQRGTTYFHGPYPGSDGTTLIVEEFTRLRVNELTWNPDPPVLGFDTVATVLAVEGVEFEFDLFAGMSATPTDYQAHVKSAAIVTCDGGRPRPLTDDEIAALVTAALAEQKRIFREMLGWDAGFKVAYGAYHYLDFLVPFITVAGAGDAVVEELRRAFASTLERRLDDVIEAESLPVWERLFARPEPLFAPTHSTAAVAKP